MDTVPRLGEWVMIPFGRGEVAAEVVRIVDIFTPPEVEVEFKIDDEEDVTMRNLYPIDMIRPAPVRSG